MQAVAVREHTRKEMYIRVIEAPSPIVLSAGTYHHTVLYAPVHPSQRQLMTSNGPPMVAPYKRCSGGGKPRHSLISFSYLSPKIKRLDTAPIVVPTPRPIKISPFWLMENPRLTMKMTGIAFSTDEFKIQGESRLQ